MALAIDLFCGLGGWTDGLLAEGYYVVGFDIERHVYGEHRYPAQLVIQNVLTLHGSQFRDATLIVASPPCQEYSYMAMPWTRAKAKAAAIRADATGKEMERLNRLFNACFRIQREACAAAGRHIPLIVENVRGAIPWVGRSRWNFGSFHLWGDVPALMPSTMRQTKSRGNFHQNGTLWNRGEQIGEGQKVPGFRFDGSGKSFQTASVERSEGYKSAGLNWSDRSKHGQDFTRVAGREAVKNAGHINKRDGHGHTRYLTNPREHVAEGRKGKGAGAEWFDGNLCQLSSASPSRKAASAMIAKIPLPLSRHIAATFKMREAA